jgi:hypothetical protein
MAEPDWNPDTAGRSLAEILREAGIEAPRSGRRGSRRWDDEDTGIRQRRSGPPTGDNPRFGRRAGDLRDDEPRTGGVRVSEDRAVRPGAADPSTAAIPGLRGPSRAPDVPGASTPAPAPRERRAAPRPEWERPADAGRPAEPERGLERERSTGRQRRVEEERTTGRQRRVEEERTTGRQPPVEEDRSTGRQRRVEEERSTGRQRPVDREPTERRRGPEPAHESTGRVSDRPVRPPADAHPSTGPIPVVRDGDTLLDEEEAGPKESALAWLRFAGELVIALAAGVGVYFLATVLWEQIPYLAVVLAPLAVTGLVAGVSVFRRRSGRDSMGAPLLAVLVFAGALLTVMPAAGLLSG